VTFLFALNLI